MATATSDEVVAKEQLLEAARKKLGEGKREATTMKSGMAAAAPKVSGNAAPARAYEIIRRGGDSSLDESLALELLKKPNPHGKPNSDVVVPWVNGLDLTRRNRGFWIIDFGVMTKEEAEQFSGAMLYVRRHVYPVRKENRREEAKSGVGIGNQGQAPSIGNHPVARLIRLSVGRPATTRKCAESVKGRRVCGPRI